MIGKTIAKFAVVGLSGAGVNMAVYASLMAMGIDYMLAATLSFLVAVTNNFIWSLLWTFKGRATYKNLQHKYVLFVVCGVINFMVNLKLLELLVEQFGISAIVAQIIAIGATGALNFVLNYSITFNDRRSEREEAATRHESSNYSHL